MTLLFADLLLFGLSVLEPGSVPLGESLDPAVVEGAAPGMLHPPAVLDGELESFGFVGGLRVLEVPMAVPVAVGLNCEIESDEVDPDEVETKEGW